MYSMGVMGVIGRICRVCWGMIDDVSATPAADVVVKSAYRMLSLAAMGRGFVVPVMAMSRKHCAVMRRY